jgi:ABC-type glycerol-3-phosphate transport system substrate-binding protein
MRHNYKLICIGTIILIALLSTQCGPPAEEVAPAVALTYVTWTSGGEVWGKAERDLFKQFEAAQPNITITPKSYVNSTRDHLTENPSPDLLFVWPYDETLVLVEEGLLLEVTDLWRELELDKAYPPQYIAMAEREGKKYYVPVSYGWTAIYYNKAIFNQYNLTPPETWAEFLTVSDTLSAKGITPFAIAGASPWMATLWFDYLNLRLNGPEFHARLIKGEERYDDARVKDVLEAWTSLQAKDYFVADAWAWEEGEALGALVKGDDTFRRPREPAAMLLSDSFRFDQVPPKFRAELGFFRFPMIDPSVPVAEVSMSIGYMVSAKAPHPSEAMEFLAYMGSTEAQSRFIQQIRALDAYLPAQAGLDEALLTPTLQQGNTLLQNAEAIGPPYYASIPGQMRGSVSGALNKLLRASTDVDSLLADLEAARQRIYANKP